MEEQHVHDKCVIITKYIVFVPRWITLFSFARTPTSAMHTGQEPISVQCTCMQPSLHTSFLRSHLPHSTFFPLQFSPLSYPLISKLCVRCSITARNRITNYWQVSAGWHFRHHTVTLPFIHCIQSRIFFIFYYVFSHSLFHLKISQIPYHMQSPQ